MSRKKVSRVISEAAAANAVRQERQQMEAVERNAVARLIEEMNASDRRRLEQRRQERAPGRKR